MSAQASQTGGSALTRPTANGTSGGTMAISQQRPNDSSVGANNSGPAGGMSQQNLNGIVSTHDFRALGNTFTFYLSTLD